MTYKSYLIPTGGIIKSFSISKITKICKLWNFHTEVMFCKEIVRRRKHAIYGENVG